MQNFMKALKGKTVAIATIASTSLVALPAMAGGGGGGVDVSGVTSAIESADTSVKAIGAAVLLVFVGIAVYKWVRRAL